MAAVDVASTPLLSGSAGDRVPSVALSATPLTLLTRTTPDMTGLPRARPSATPVSQRLSAPSSPVTSVRDLRRRSSAGRGGFDLRLPRLSDKNLLSLVDAIEKYGDEYYDRRHTHVVVEDHTVRSSMAPDPRFILSRGESAPVFGKQVLRQAIRISASEARHGLGSGLPPHTPTSAASHRLALDESMTIGGMPSGPRDSIDSTSLLSLRADLLPSLPTLTPQSMYEKPMSEMAQSPLGDLWELSDEEKKEALVEAINRINAIKNGLRHEK